MGRRLKQRNEVLRSALAVRSGDLSALCTVMGATRRREPTNQPTNQCRPTYSRCVAAALAAIERQYDEALSTAAIARRAGVSRSHLCMRFRREVGRTLRQHLNATRVRVAKARIESGEKVEAVALSVGFRSLWTFYRQYRAHAGGSPRSARQLRAQYSSSRRPLSP